VAYLSLPGGLVPLLAAAVAGRFGLAATLRCYLVIAVALAAVTVLLDASLDISARTTSPVPR